MNVKITISILFLLLGVGFTFFVFNREYFVSSDRSGKATNTILWAEFESFLSDQEWLDYRGQSFSVDRSVFKGDRIVFHFWASWCEPCINEIPELIEYSMRSSAVKIVLVSQDESTSEIDKFLKSFPKIADPRFFKIWDKDSKIANYVNADRLPMSVFFDSTKKEPRIFKSVVDWKTIRF